MATIYKYPIKITDKQKLRLPKNSKIVRVGTDPKNQPCIWAIVNTDEELEEVIIYVVGTGNPFPQGAEKHIGSFKERSFIWHVFTKRF